MKRFVRSTFMTCAVALAVAAPATVAQADSQEIVQSRTPAPACVTYSADWRYTFVTNNCSTPLTLKVVYGNGWDVPCQQVAAGGWFTFPGYGTSGNTVEGVVLCDAADAA